MFFQFDLAVLLHDLAALLARGHRRKIDAVLRCDCRGHPHGGLGFIFSASALDRHVQQRSDLRFDIRHCGLLWAPGGERHAGCWVNYFDGWR